MCDKMIQFNKIPIFSLWNILFLNHLYCKLRGKTDYLYYFVFLIKILITYTLPLIVICK